ncbi:MAG: hypothetical protein CM15mP49_26190 [Actinomycetota bacterium]|nr:MAG: hypothetical protein CM15mP49_26190 [Actinomycetota bacterium]
MAKNSVGKISSFRVSAGGGLIARKKVEEFEVGVLSTVPGWGLPH